MENLHGPLIAKFFIYGIWRTLDTCSHLSCCIEICTCLTSLVGMLAAWIFSWLKEAKTRPIGHLEQCSRLRGRTCVHLYVRRCVYVATVPTQQKPVATPCGQSTFVFFLILSGGWASYQSILNFHIYATAQAWQLLWRQLPTKNYILDKVVTILELWLHWLLIPFRSVNPSIRLKNYMLIFLASRLGYIYIIIAHQYIIFFKIN